MSNVVLKVSQKFLSIEFWEQFVTTLVIEFQVLPCCRSFQKSRTKKGDFANELGSHATTSFEKVRVLEQIPSNFDNFDKVKKL